MLSKLLRHEFRATVRIMLPLYLMMAASALLFNLFMHLAQRYDVWPLQIFRGISGFAFFVTLFGAGVVTLCLMMYRFYKNYMTDEGYLMFTLPVTTAQLIWAKLIVALVWTAVTLLVMAAAAFLGTMGQPFWKDLLTGLNEAFGFLFGEIPTADAVTYILEAAGLALVGTTSSYLMFYAAISLGHSMANHKILYSVGFYIAFNIALQSVSSFASIFGIAAADNADLFSRELNSLAVLHWILLGSILVSVVVSVAFYVLTHVMLKKRLNLQ